MVHEAELVAIGLQLRIGACALPHQLEELVVVHPSKRQRIGCLDPLLAYFVLLVRGRVVERALVLVRKEEASTYLIAQALQKE